MWSFIKVQKEAWTAIIKKERNQIKQTFSHTFLRSAVSFVRFSSSPKGIAWVVEHQGPLWPHVNVISFSILLPQDPLMAIPVWQEESYPHFMLLKSGDCENQVPCSPRSTDWFSIFLGHILPSRLLMQHFHRQTWAMESSQRLPLRSTLHSIF